MQSRLHPSGPPEVILWRRLFGYLEVVHLEIRIRMIMFLVLLTPTKVVYLIILLVQEKLLMLRVCWCTCRSNLLCSGSQLAACGVCSPWFWLPGWQP